MARDGKIIMQDSMAAPSFDEAPSRIDLQRLILQLWRGFILGGSKVADWSEDPVETLSWTNGTPGPDRF